MSRRKREPDHRCRGADDAAPGLVEGADRRQARAAVKGSAALLAALVRAHGRPPADMAVPAQDAIEGRGA